MYVSCHKQCDPGLSGGGFATAGWNYIYIYIHIYIYIYREREIHVLCLNRRLTYISRTKVSELFASVQKVWSRRAEGEDRGCEMRT